MLIRPIRRWVGFGLFGRGGPSSPCRCEMCLPAGHGMPSRGRGRTSSAMPTSVGGANIDYGVDLAEESQEMSRWKGENSKVLIRTVSVDSPGTVHTVNCHHGEGVVAAIGAPSNFSPVVTRPCQFLLLHCETCCIVTSLSAMIGDIKTLSSSHRNYQTWSSP